jgi:hypothetical protein
MKSLFIAHMLLIDCGKASKQTKGTLSGVFTEAGTAPLNKYNQ